MNTLIQRLEITAEELEDKNLKLMAATVREAIKALSGDSSERQVDAGVMEGDSRNSGQLTVDNIKNVIENPDLMTSGCKEHLFYIKGNIIVYSKLMFNSDERYEVICADILKKPKSS